MHTPKKLHLHLMAATLVVASLIMTKASPAAASEVAESRRLGIGVMVGAPTGLSLKYYFSPRHALDFGLGVGFWGGPTLYLHGDYKLHFMLTRNSAFDLPLYIGVGAKLTVWFDNHDHAYWGDNDVHSGYLGFGIRVPIGIAFNLGGLPLDIFFEIVPGLGLFPGIGAFVDGAIGVRWYF